MSKLPFRDFLRGLYHLLAARPRVPRSLAGNELLRTLLARRSVRRFRDDPIDDDIWSAILEAGRLAPSTVNLQTWSFAVFTRREWHDFFASPLPFDARRAIIVLADTHRARRVISDFPRAPLCEYTVGVMNASLAAMNLVTAAEALGICSVMLSETGRTGFYDARYLARRLSLPPSVIPLMTIVFGYPAGGNPVMPPKLPPEAVCFSGPYRETSNEVLADWYRQMQAGFQASHRGVGFAGRIDHYKRRIAEAEQGLREMVFPDEGTGSG